MDAATDLLINMGLVAALVEAIKRVFGPGFNTERFGPALALIVGVATAEAGSYLGWFPLIPQQAVLVGLTAGLGASGLYRTVTRQA